jgi:hypothetical protein
MNSSYLLQLSVVEVKDILLRLAARRRREPSSAQATPPPRAPLTDGGVIARLPVPRSPLSD